MTVTMPEGRRTMLLAMTPAQVRRLRATCRNEIRRAADANARNDLRARIVTDSNEKTLRDLDDLGL